jgi:4-aminobutyrate aminotransferase-like enzyme
MVRTLIIGTSKIIERLKLITPENVVCICYLNYTSAELNEIFVKILRKFPNWELIIFMTGYHDRPLLKMSDSFRAIRNLAQLCNKTPHVFITLPSYYMLDSFIKNSFDTIRNDSNYIILADRINSKIKQKQEDEFI